MTKPLCPRIFWYVANTGIFYLVMFALFGCVSSLALKHQTHLQVNDCFVILVASSQGDTFVYFCLLSCFSLSLLAAAQPLSGFLKRIKGITGARISPFFVGKLLLSCAFVILHAEKLQCKKLAAISLHLKAA